MTQKPQKPENRPPADERNIVEIDPSYEGASFEDRLFLIWHEYKKVILGAIAAIALVLAGWGIITIVQQRQEARIATEFQEAVAMDDIKAFAEKNSPHPLAAVAYLEVADYHFANGDFEEAARYYDLAARDFGDAPPAGRAKIGQGVSMAQAGQEAEALSHFEQVAGDPGNYSVIRAEAYYHAATLAMEAGQTDTAHDYIERVSEIDRSQMWTSRAFGLRQALPERTADEEDSASPAAEVSDAS